MQFNSYQFIIFFIVVFLFYWNVSHSLQNRFLLIASYIFYAWWSWKFLFLIFISTFINYYCGNKIYKASDSGKKKVYLCISVVSCIGILAFFKYSNFFIEELYGLLYLVGVQNHPWQLWEIILPIGISFYIFQTLSYTIDLYRGKILPTSSYIEFSLFVAFFPQLVAGPIEKASNLLPQIMTKRIYDYNKVSSGFRLALYGMFQKVVIADTLGRIVDNVYQNVVMQTSGTLIVATYFFAFQIYCDFAGYTNIARGVARMLGFELCLNFNCPYFSKNLTAFWRRWHMSLTGWFREYVYLPLGGNRVSNTRRFFNVMVVFLLSGLWHGPNWTFIIWGAIHGLFFFLYLVFDKVIKHSIPENNFPGFLKVFFTFHLVCFAWIFFRANSLSEAYYIIEKITHLKSLSLDPILEYFFILNESILSFSNIHIGIILVCGLLIAEWAQNNIPLFISRLMKCRWITFPLYYITITSILYCTGQAPFIYFQF